MAPTGLCHRLEFTPGYVANRKTNFAIMRRQAKKGTCSFHGHATAYAIRKGGRYTVALTAETRNTTMAEVVRERLRPVRAAEIHVHYSVLDRRFYSVEVIRDLQRSRTPFPMQVLGHGDSVKHLLGPSGLNVYWQGKVSGWSEYKMSDAIKHKVTV